MDGILFPEDLPENEWSRFRAAGYHDEVCGVIYRGKSSPVTCGMPVGGIDTGCFDLETSGLMGYCSIFNSHVPRKGPLNQPFLGISTEGRTWVLCIPEKAKTYEHLTSGYSHEVKMNNCVRQGMMCHSICIEPDREGLNPDSPVDPFNIEGVELPREIYYWGHYPTVDLEFDIDSPVGIALRCWCPFIPGDLNDSMIPGAVFEVHLLNKGKVPHKGTVALNFPGPTNKEAGCARFLREYIGGKFTGVWVKGKKADCAAGVVDGENVKAGGSLGINRKKWADISNGLPFPSDENGDISISADFSLEPGEKKVIRLVVSWYSPEWKGGGTSYSEIGNTYSHMYARYQHSALHAALLLSERYKELSDRIISWQEVLYSDKEIPGWLGDVLINNFHLITEVGMWAQSKPPVGDWCKPDNGIWGLNESPRCCPQIECGPLNSYYAGMPLLYFFPQLTLSTLQAYKEYQFPNGCPSWIFGGCTAGTPPCEMTMPSYGYQTGQNGSWFVGIIARYWHITGDNEFLKEFYPAVKKATIYTFTLDPDDPYGLISLPDYDPMEGYEFVNFTGMTSHVGSIRLYHLKMAEAMAEQVEDKDFACQCKNWYEKAKKMMDDYLWNGSYYIQSKKIKRTKKKKINFINGPITEGNKPYDECPEEMDEIDLIMAYQLDGEVMACHDGLHAPVFNEDKIKTILNRIKLSVIDEWGPRIWSNPDGTPVDDGKFNTGYFNPHGVHVPGAIMFAMAYMYYYGKDFGIEVVKKVMTNMVCKKGWTWDMPILFRGDNGEGIWGNDYAQMMSLWMLPAAITGGDLTDVCRKGGLVARIIEAGNKDK